MNRCFHRDASLRAPTCRRLMRWSGAACPGDANVERKRAGFTLIELMVVLVLIGILSAMIVSEMKGTFADALLRSSGRELVNAFKLAYSQAVSLNQVHIVQLDEKTGHYVVARQAKGRGNRVEFVPLKDTSGSSGSLDNRITMEVRKPADDSEEKSQTKPEPLPAADPASKPGNALTFYPDGTADAADVVLRDAAGVGLRLRIDPITARVEILELAAEPQ